MATNATVQSVLHAPHWSLAVYVSIVILAMFILVVMWTLKANAEKKNRELQSRYSNLQRTNEQLQNKLREFEHIEIIGTLARGIAHDFSNQLAGITGYAEILRRDRKGDELIDEGSEIILRCAQRASALTATLLGFARQTSYQALLTNMHEVIRAVVSILEQSVDKSISIHMNFESKECLVTGDPRQLKSALLSIAINARDAMPNGGRLEIATRQIESTDVLLKGTPLKPGVDQYIDISLADTGTGIADEVLEHIYEPFFSTKGSDHGKGLGLAAVKGIVGAHNGLITVNTTVGKGSTFHLCLPLAMMPETPPSISSVNVTASGHAGKILVVDDEVVIRQIISRHLNQLGYIVDVVGDGAEAIQIFTQAAGKYDLVLLDLVIPKVDGPSVFAAFKGINKDIKVVLITGHAEELVVNELKHCGLKAMLSKPFTLSQLASVVSETIKEA